MNLAENANQSVNASELGDEAVKKIVGIAMIDGIALVSAETAEASDAKPVILMGGVDAVKIKKDEAVVEPFDTVVTLSDVQIIDNTFLRTIRPFEPMRMMKPLGEMVE